jgi:hypothetical protein
MHDMTAKLHLRRYLLVLTLAAAFTPAWCPEAPLLQEIPPGMLASHLQTSTDEVLALLVRQPRPRPPLHLEAIAEAVGEASRANGLPPELLLAVIAAESGFRREAVSHKGAVGLMQLMPRTAEEIASELRIPWTDELLLHDPGTNVAMGAYYLRNLLDYFRDLDKALAGYNRGPYGLPPGGGPWRGETGAYVRRVNELIARQGIVDQPRPAGDPRPFEISGRLGL